MISRKALALAVVTVYLAIQQTYALKCWECAGIILETGETNGDEWCLDPFDHDNAPESNLKECQNEACVKVDITFEGGYIVLRSCTNRNFCSEVIDGDDFTITYCKTCETDGCNAEENLSSGFTNYPVILLVAISAVTSIVIRI